MCRTLSPPKNRGSAPCSQLQGEERESQGATGAATVRLIEPDYLNFCPLSLSLGFIDSCLYAARLGLFLSCFRVYMKCFAPKENYTV